MSNIVSRPHMRHDLRFVDPEHKKRIAYDRDKRNEEQGKKPIYLHEQPAKVKRWPSTEMMQARVTEFFKATGHLPVRLVVPFQTDAPWMGYPISGLPLPDGMKMRDGRHFIDFAVEYNPDIEGIQLV